MSNIQFREIPLSPTEKLDEFVFVNDKIITYKTASALLGIKTIESQKYFEKYLKECNEPEKKVYLTYILGGVTAERKRKVIIVDQNNYEKVKDELKDIFIDKIYSLQKASNVTWESIFNIDDFLYTEKKIVSVPINNNNQTKVNDVKETKNETRVEKKGSISTFFNQKQSKPKEVEKKPALKVQGKKNDIKNMFSKVPSKPKLVSNGVNKNKVVEDDDNEEIVRKSNKKRSRVMIDDDDDDSNSAKYVKADILDSDNESEKENMESGDEMEDEKMEVDGSENDRDIFDEPPPEKKPHIEKPSKKRPVEESNIVEPSKKRSVEESKKVGESKQVKSKKIEESKKMDEGKKIEKAKEAEVPKPIEETEPVEEPKDLMYEDDDGFFVTEKTSKKRVNNKPFTEEEKKVIQKELAVQKINKKEVKEKIQKNTNQKTLFNFFKKV